MPQVEFETRLATACEGTELPVQNGALARQPGCASPVKLARDASGRLELRAEILRRFGRDAVKLARDALDFGQAWLTDAPRHPGAQPGLGEVEEALQELPRPWAWGPAPEGGFHVHALGYGASVRVAVHPRPGGAQAMARTSLPVEGTATAAALSDFALRANRRLRLARISVDTNEEGAASVSWDAFLPSEVLVRDLSEAVEAVFGAHVASGRAFRALCQPAVAGAYLAMNPTVDGAYLAMHR